MSVSGRLDIQYATQPKRNQYLYGTSKTYTEREATGRENEQGSIITCTALQRHKQKERPLATKTNKDRLSFKDIHLHRVFFVKHAQSPAGVFTLGSNLAHGAAAGGAAPAEGFLGSTRGIFISGGTCNRDSGNIVVSTMAQYTLQRRVDTAVGKFSDFVYLSITDMADCCNPARGLTVKPNRLGEKPYDITCYFKSKLMNK